MCLSVNHPGFITGVDNRMTMVTFSILQPSSMLIICWIIVQCMVVGQVEDLVDGLTRCA